MKNKEIVLITIGFVTLVLLCLGIYIFIEQKTEYTLNLPSIENLDSINLENKNITEKEKIEEILNILNKEKRTTKEESIQDSPVNVSDKIKIEFHFKNGGTSTLFIYRKNKYYYIEQPYNGIYKITENEYKKIKDICYN